MKLGMMSMLMITVAGCTVTPTPFTKAELATFAADKSQRAIAATQEPVTQSIDLYEAMARALKYNLDHKLELAEVSLRYAEVKDGEFDMLPDLVGRVNWADRSNDPFSNSLQEDGTVSAGQASTSEDIGSYDADLELSWDILDFGLSYYRAQQTADKFLIAEEQRRSTINRVIEDVRTSYWRAVAAQRLLVQVDRLEKSANRALSSATQQLNRGEGDRLEALRYQREMLETIRRAQELRRDLSVAKNQLAALMNLPQGQTFSVVLPDHHHLKTPITALSSEKMTEMALRNRPEMREIAYRLRINESEEDSSLLSLLPSMRGYLGVNYDSNDLLVNNDWTQWGARVSWDLMNIARYPLRKKVVAGQEALLDARALALTQAIATQVYVSNKRFHSLQKEAKVAKRLHEVSDRIYRQARSEFNSGVSSERELVRENLNAILASLRYDATYAQMQGAFANVYAAVGLDAFDGRLTGNESVEDLAASLRKLWRSRGDK
ncbi:TolC family protein [Rhodalgimonas zhirmunskyi]|uniref:TolC family protein n=1 Tax=Rhodalgimonas zhirmunskyi TaxID=2964767 RepID=UPI00295293CC|nr:TolC family protein [Rhodoalgimonas zhirmunskyi]